MEPICSHFIGRSEAFLRVNSLIQKIAACSANVLVRGETGTGKELAARTIHYSGPRKSGPFVPVNCAGIPDTLFESELFGHEKGAFTNAGSARTGLVAAANRGTLFLDEVDALSLKGQAALLRFLQDAQFRPVGSVALRTADVRVVAASNADLEAAVRARSFREDLYFRLNALTIELPPLRERRVDIPFLTDFFVERYRDARGSREIVVGVATRTALTAYAWPGNIRELENVVLRGIVLAEGNQFALPEHVQRAGLAAGGQDDCDSTPVYSGSMREICQRELRKVEENYLRWLLHQTKGNISAAAKKASTERRHMGRKLRQLGIDHLTYR
ncbi:sigma-54 dependent transcriptional regulator [Bradyrhizobium sp. 170]|uniref:sigma-54 interaction domain-containing protein n=1 Tax=Bradyrhizobium sp. 170 TaxID=2782641 RepID=UPI001FFE30A7|nr:sigma-54 dependent transcriptional regulator [Bradyrhizobium sp. 170]UPK05421.1 sigma-54-dependent Fis family transcriptional regulator [Bradyrhizobium sp. 170]